MDKKQIESSSQLPGKLADKALASLPGIIGSILSWILFELFIGLDVRFNILFMFFIGLDVRLSFHL